MTDRNALAIAALTSLTWGLTGVFVRLLPGIPPLAITAGRLTIALFAVLPAFLLLGKSRAGLGGGIKSGFNADFRAALRRPAAYALASLLVGYYLLATAAFQLAPVAEVALLISTPPLFILAFRALHGQMPALAETVGALLALGGTILILAPTPADAGTSSAGHLYGSAMALGAAALSALYAYAYRHLSEHGRAPETSAVTLLTFAIGSPALLAAASLFSTSAMPAISGSGTIAVFLGLGIVSTAIPTLGFSIASRRLPAIVTTTISLFVPLFAGLFAYLALGERLSPNFAAGCLPVLAGVALIIRQSRARPNA